MVRLCYFFLLLALCACGGGAGKEDKEENSFTYEGFSNRFKTVSPPYALSDTGLLANKDTAALSPSFVQNLISDSVKNLALPGAKTIRYVPLAKIAAEGETYYLLKLEAAQKKAAVLVAFDKEGKNSASFPFLVPDKDPATNQTSSIDKSLSISRNTLRRAADESTKEGKDVHIYNPASGGYTLIMTEILDEDTLGIINPIDTFSKKNRLAGDYYNGQRNLVSIRDGRTPSELSFFVSIAIDADCKGELKGTAFMTGTTTAAYRQGGDPCVLEMSFGANTVTLREVEGCGARRGLDCAFNGTYKKKAAPKPKKPAKTSKKKSNT